jgi:hypothetical protein
MINEPIEFTSISPSGQSWVNEYVKMVRFQENSVLEFLPNQIFTTYPNLKTLYIASVGLKTLKGDSFKGAGKLETLFIDNNLLTNLSGKIFKPLENLQKLYAQNNPYQYIDRQVFDVLKNLNFLDLSNSGCIDRQFESGVEEKYFENCFANVPAGIDQVGDEDDSVKKTDSDPGTGKIRLFCEGTNERWYNFFYGASCFIKGAKITKDMTNKEFEFISYSPEGTLWFNEFVKFVRFEEDSKLEFIPREFFSTYSNLIGLYMGFVGIQDFDKDSFKGAGKLESLFIDNNQLTRLDGWTFEPLKNLKQLYAQDNKFEFIDIQAFEHMPQLIFADFTNSCCIDKKFNNDFSNGSLQYFAGCRTLNNSLNSRNSSTSSSPFKHQSKNL